MKNKMKWPEWIMLIRHDTSEYNLQKGLKDGDRLYQMFLSSWNKSHNSKETQNLARQIAKKYALIESDSKTKLADSDGKQPLLTGQKLSGLYEIPDVIFCSPYVRTQKTLEHLICGWPALSEVKVLYEERIREQEHGLGTIFGDWRAFQSLFPEQKLLYDKEGRYRYRHPQGENVPDVRLRNQSWLSTVTRDFAGKRVLVITHHLTILAMRANLERLDENQFIALDEKEKPINSGVTLYTGNPTIGTEGRLELTYYNKKYY